MFRRFLNSREAKKFAKENAFVREQLAAARARANAAAVRARANAAAAAARRQREEANKQEAINLAKAVIESEKNERVRQIAANERFARGLQSRPPPPKVIPLSVYTRLISKLRYLITYGRGTTRLKVLLNRIVALAVKKRANNTPRTPAARGNNTPRTPSREHWLVPPKRTNFNKNMLRSELRRLTLTPVPADGDCFFHSLRIASGIKNNPEQMRGKVATKIMSNWNSNQGKTIYLGGKDYSYANRTGYNAILRHTRCWVGDDEIEAASQVYKRNIIIVSQGNNMMVYPRDQDHPDWPRVYLHANIAVGTQNQSATMSHFQAFQ